MCGIIGIASNKPVSTNIINSLKKLEYRGYDSAGLATLTKNTINEKKCSGRIEEIEKIVFKTHSPRCVLGGSRKNIISRRILQPGKQRPVLRALLRFVPLLGSISQRV